MVRKADDSRLRVISGFKGNSVCEVMSEYIKNEDGIYVNWISPKEHSGIDDASNLMLLKYSFKILPKNGNRGNYYKDNENYQKNIKNIF